MKPNTLKSLVCLLALASSCHSAAAAVSRPANDNLAAATAINTTRITLSNQSGLGATVEKGEPAFNAVTPVHTTWYKLVMPFNGYVTGLAPKGTGAAPRIVVWGTPFQGRTFGELNGATEDSAFSNYRRASAAFSAGQTVVVSLDASVATSLTLIVNRDLADDVLTAPLYTGAITQQSDLRNITTSADEDGYLPAQRMAWAAITSTEASLLIDTFGSSAGGAEIPSSLLVFSGDPVTGLNLLTEGGAVPNSSSSSLIFSPTAGELYFVAYAASATFGKLCLNLNSNTQPGSFSVVTPEGYGLTPENAGSITAWIRRTNAAGAATVDYATTEDTATAGSDFTAIPTTTLSFATGEFFKPVTISITADSVADDFEFFSLDLTNAVGDTLGDETSLPVVITDGTGKSAMILSTATTKVVEGGSLVLTVTRHGTVAGQASAWVVPATSPEAFTNLPTPVTFSPGQSTAIIQVTLADDAKFGGDKTASIDLANVVGADDVGEPISVTIQDNDAYQPIAARYRVLTDGFNTSRDPALFDIATTALGACTGKLIVAMVSYPVSARLDAQGQCRIIIPRTVGAPLVADLRVVNAMHLLRCEVSEFGSLVAHAGESYPIVARTAASPHPKTGRYNTTSDGLAVRGTPSALLFSSTVAKTGTVTGVGFTADNKAFTFSGPLNSDNAVSVLTGSTTGYVASNINYAGSALAINSLSTVRWLKRPVAAGGILAGGVDVAFIIATSAYAAPAANKAAMSFLDVGSLPKATLYAGDAFALETIVNMTVSKVNVLVPSSNGLKLTVVSSTGTFNGSVKADNGKIHTIRGILSTGGFQGVGVVFGPTYSSHMSFF